MICITAEQALLLPTVVPSVVAILVMEIFSVVCSAMKIACEMKTFIATQALDLSFKDYQGTLNTYTVSDMGHTAVHILFQMGMS